MNASSRKPPKVTATHGDLQGSAVVRFDVKVKGDAVTVIVGVDKRSVQVYFGNPGLVSVGTGTVPPKGPKGKPVDVFAAGTGSVPPKGPKGKPGVRPKSLKKASRLLLAGDSGPEGGVPPKGAVG